MRADGISSWTQQLSVDRMLDDQILASACTCRIMTPAELMTRAATISVRINEIRGTSHEDLHSVSMNFITALAIAK